MKHDCVVRQPDLVERRAVVGVGREFKVADNRRLQDVGAVDAELVFPCADARGQAEEAVPVRGGEALPRGCSGERVGFGVVRPGDADAVVVDAEARLDVALVALFKLAVDDGEVVSLDLARLELEREALGDLFRPRDEEATGRRLVKSVYGVHIRSTVVRAEVCTGRGGSQSSEVGISLSEGPLPARMASHVDLCCEP